MHFAILDIEKKKDENGSYISYAISINGGHHSSLRYRQLRELHDQLKNDFGVDKVPSGFPAKKLRSLNETQIGERREQLEKYLQAVSQNTELVSSRAFTKFLLKAQKESNNVEEEDVKLDLYLMNGKKFQVDIRNTDSTDHVMQEAMAHIKLPENLIEYFALFLVQREEDGEISIVRRLQDFESPYIALMAYKDAHRLVIRKNFWNTKTEEKLYTDKIALNLLYVQAVSDVERDWVVTTPEILRELNNLKKRNQREKYLKLARAQKYYGCIQFKSCLMDFPDSDSHVIINVGGFELGFRTLETSEKKSKEGSFKVTRVRCWRVISSKDSKDGELVTKISFQYLFSKEKLEWITITSEQAMLISLCLQSMVDEIINNKTKEKSSASKDSKATPTVAVTSSTKENPVKPATITKNEKPSTITKNEKPSTITKNEKPSTITKNEKPSTITNNEKPSTITNNEKPSTTTNNEKPSTTTNNEKPSTTTNNEKPSTTTNNEKPVEPQKRDSISSSDSNEDSHTQKNGEKETKSSTTGKSSKKGHRKKMAQVKNEVFALDIGDEDL